MHLEQTGRGPALVLRRDELRFLASASWAGPASSDDRLGQAIETGVRRAQRVLVEDARDGIPPRPEDLKITVQYGRWRPTLGVLSRLMLRYHDGPISTSEERAITTAAFGVLRGLLTGPTDTRIFNYITVDTSTPTDLSLPAAPHAEIESAITQPTDTGIAPPDPITLALAQNDAVMAEHAGR